MDPKAVNVQHTIWRSNHERNAVIRGGLTCCEL